MENEIWKVIPNFEGYEVSNYGNVRSIDRYILQRRGSAYSDDYYLRFMKGRPLKPHIIWSNDKYPHSSITLGKDNRFLIHRLVLFAFVGPCPDGMECCHNDGNGLNNRLDNLRWDTPSNNQLDRKKHGTQTITSIKGSKNHFAKLTEEEVLHIRSIPNYRGKNKDMCKKYNYSRSSMSSILQGKTWKHI